MLNTSQLYKDLFNEGAVQEYKVIINDTEYIGQIFGQPTLSQRLFDKDTLTVGSFTSAVFRAKLSVASETIPRNANVEFQYRYTDGTRNSEWITKFKGKLTKRTKESEDVTSIEAKDRAINYDVFLDYFNEAIAAYPANTRVVANLCADHLGLAIDNIEDVIDMNVVEYPNEMTIVEVLKNIAALSGGNWTITENETLKLIVLENDNLIPCSDDLSCFTGVEVTNTSTYSFKELQDGADPNAFVGDSPYRRIQVDFGYKTLYPSLETYPSKNTYTGGSD